MSSMSSFADLRAFIRRMMSLPEYLALLLAAWVPGLSEAVSTGAAMIWVAAAFCVFSLI